MFEKLSEILNLLMERDKINSSELARKTGIPASTIKKIRNNQKPNPTLSTLIPLAESFSVSVSQLIGEERLAREYCENDIEKEIPIIGWNDARKWPKEDIKINKTLRTFNSYSTNAFGLIIECDGIQDLPRETTILIEPQSEPSHMDIVLVDKAEGFRPALKQIIYENDHIYLKPMIAGLNISQMTHDYTILGVVFEILRTTKKNNI